MSEDDESLWFDHLQAELVSLWTEADSAEYTNPNHREAHQKLVDALADARDWLRILRGVRNR